VLYDIQRRLDGDTLCVEFAGGAETGGGSLEASLDDPAHPHVTYRRGASGQPVPVIRGTGVRVQTLETARRVWGLSEEQIANEYGLSEIAVRDALAFTAAHQAEIDAAIASDMQIEPADG
jgi:uncharacterized protein (DUF433 family)